MSIKICVFCFCIGLLNSLFPCLHVDHELWTIEDGFSKAQQRSIFRKKKQQRINPPFSCSNGESKISRVYLRNGFVLFIRIKTKCMCTKKVPARAVRFPTMSINHVSLFNQQRIFVTEKLLIQTALEQANPIKKKFTYVQLSGKPCACYCTKHRVNS